MNFYYSEHKGELIDREMAIENPELVIIEDPNMVQTDESGRKQPTYEFIDALTIRIHPKLLDAFLSKAELLWTADEVVEALA